MIPIQHTNKFFRKSGFIRRHTIVQKDFERTCADCRISGKKGFASRLNNSLDWWCKAHFFCAYAKEVLLRGSDDFSFLLFLWAVSGKPCLTARSTNGTSRHARQANREEWFYPSDRTRSARHIKSYFPAGGLPGFTPPAVSLFLLAFSLFHGFLFWSFPVQSASTSVYLHFHVFQWAASGSHFRSGRKGNSGIGRECKVKPPVFGKNLQPCG